MPHRLIACALVILSASCDRFPRDPERTLERVTEAELRVGVAENPPWVESAESEPAGLEPELVRQLAEALEAEVKWTRGGTEDLLRLLERRELDLVIAGLTPASPWKNMVALSSPYYGESMPKDQQRVFAAPPGENGWLLHLERFLRSSDTSRRVHESLNE